VSLDSVKILRSLAMSLIEGGVIEARTSYEKSSSAGLGMLVMQLSGQLEVATEWLVAENATLRALFRRAAEQVTEPGLADRIGAAGRGFEAGLRFSVLRGVNDELRGLLIELHAHVEGQGGDAARELDREIWSELERSVVRRAMV
jgi:hypothetical protein